MNFKRPYLFIYDTGEIDTFRNVKDILKKVDSEDLITGKLFKIVDTNGTYKDLMVVDTLNGEGIYNNLQEALEAHADYRSESIEEFIEEKGADVDILTHPEKYSDADVVQEIMKAFDFVGNEGTEEFITFLKVEPIPDDVQEELQDHMSKGLEEIRFKELAEKKLEEFKVELDDYFGDKIGTEVYGNPLLRVENYQFKDSYTDLYISVNLDGTLKARPVSDRVSKEERIIESPEDVSKFMEDLIPLAEKQRQKDESWKEFEREAEKELEDLCYQKGATNVYASIWSSSTIHIEVSAYNKDGFMFGYELKEVSDDKIELYEKIYDDKTGLTKILIKKLNKMSYPEALKVIENYVKNVTVNESSKKQTRLSKVLNKIENSMSLRARNSLFDFKNATNISVTGNTVVLQHPDRLNTLEIGLRCDDENYEVTLYDPKSNKIQIHNKLQNTLEGIDELVDNATISYDDAKKVLKAFNIKDSVINRMFDKAHYLYEYKQK